MVGYEPMTDGAQDAATNSPPARFAGFHSLSLPTTAVTFRNKHGTTEYLETTSSSVLFARLHTCAEDAEDVVSFVQDGRVLTPAGLATLNCYLRSIRIGRCGLPWHRGTLTRSKHDWRAFVTHLELEFAA